MIASKSVSKRLKATSIHLILSAIAFFIVLYFILVHWYPKPHFAVNGGWQGVRIMLFVDIVLGPFLTLILFNPLKSKKAITFDLSIIVSIQISAFTWGVYAVHSQHPVALAFWKGIIYLILQCELSVQDKNQADIQLLDNGNPPVVFVRKPVSGDEVAGVISFALIEYLSEKSLYFLYDPIKDHVEELFVTSLDIEQKSPEKIGTAKNNYLNKKRLQHDEIAFVPFDGRYGTSLLIFDRSGNIIDAISDPRYEKKSSFFF